MLFSRGNAISGEPIIKGTNQFPKQPIKIGITIKKIIIKACAVTITLYNCSLHKNPEGNDSWIRIITLILVPIIPAQTPVIKYNVPISLWLHERSHLSFSKIEIKLLSLLLAQIIFILFI